MKRRKAREYVLQFLYRTDFLRDYSNDTAGPKDLSELTNDVHLFLKETGEDDPEVKKFAEDLITGTINNIVELDSILQKTAEKWKLLRMASVDRNIMRFAAYELLFRKDIPSAVTINEALEIAKKFSTAESASFINGILDKIAKEHKEAESQ